MLYRYYETTSDAPFFFKPMPEENNELNSQKGVLLSAIESRYPLALLQFFNKWKQSLIANDMAFVMFMKKKLVSRAMIDNRYSVYVDALDVELSMLQNLNMHMQ